MRNQALTILLIGLLGIPAMAQDDKPRPDIEELLTVMRVQKLSENSASPVKGMLAGIAKQTGIPAGDMAKSNEMLDKMFALTEREMSWEKMKPGYIKLYAEIYTPDEIKQLIAFYKSPVGQMLLDKEPLLTQKTMEMTQKKMMDVLPEMMRFMKEDIEAPSKRDSKADGAAPSSSTVGRRKAALQVLDDLRLLDSATDQYAIETNKTTGFKPTFADLKNFLKSGTVLYSTGADVFGTPYGPFAVDSIPKVSASTFNALSDVADDSFWSPFK